MSGAGLVILVPVHDELETIGPLLDRLKALLPEAAIVVIDDGSRDGSGAIAAEHGIHVVTHCTRSGYGAALRSGLAASRSTAVAIIDADGSYDPSDLADLHRRYREGGMIIGARRIEPNRPRRWVKSMFRAMVALATGRRVPDLNSGLRIFDRRLAERLFPVLPSRFSFTTTMTLGAIALGAPVEFVPVAFRVRSGRSKFAFLDVLLFARTVLRGCRWIRDRRTLESSLLLQAQVDSAPATL